MENTNATNQILHRLPIEVIPTPKPRAEVADQHKLPMPKSPLHLCEYVACVEMEIVEELAVHLNLLDVILINAISSLYGLVHRHVL